MAPTYLFAFPMQLALILPVLVMPQHPQLLDGTALSLVRASMAGNAATLQNLVLLQQVFSMIVVPLLGTKKSTFYRAVTRLQSMGSTSGHTSDVSGNKLLVAQLKAASAVPPNQHGAIMVVSSHFLFKLLTQLGLAKDAANHVCDTIKATTPNSPPPPMVATAGAMQGPAAGVVQAPPAAVVTEPSPAGEPSANSSSGAHNM
jgi:hypothetical protein